MMIHWMMNNPWPSFFGHLFDDYYKQGGGYFGAKKGLRPINVVWDYYASGDRSKAKLYVVNQTARGEKQTESSRGILQPGWDAKVLYRDQQLQHRAEYFPRSHDGSPNPESRSYLPGSRVLMGSADEDAADKDKVLAENVYWESTTDDDLGEAKNDEQFKTTLAKWADLSALNTMPRSDLNVSASSHAGESNGEKQVTITLANPGNHVAFFVRAEVTQGSGENSDSGEILPIIYDDNYVTVFPHETRTIEATFQSPGTGPSSLAVRVEGYNVAKQVLGVRVIS